MKFLTVPGINFVFQLPPGITFTDYTHMHAIQLTPDWFEERGSGTFRFPITAHPSFYLAGCDLVPSAPPQVRRPFRVLFVGRASQELYDRASMYKLFGCETRFECRRGLEAAFPFACRNAKSRSDGGLVFHFTEEHGDLDVADYSTLLDDSDFFLALPGQGMPESHNCTESMSRGCIPILAYAGRFNPPLVHNVNCLEYDGTKSDLLKSVTIARDMHEDQVIEMRKNVKSYYSAHLALDSLACQIIASAESLVHLQLMAEWRSISLHARRTSIKSRT